MTDSHSSPYSDGPLELPYQRPSTLCRTFHSPLVEEVIRDMTERIKDPDLAFLFRNAFPNTLDTTVRWHVDGKTKKAPKYTSSKDAGRWEGPQSFIVTGDINAEWLRDSTNQLAQYQLLAPKDPAVSTLILGAINTQAEFVIEAPYCNAFQPPRPANLFPISNGQEDIVHPAYEPSFVFECKYELDSLAHFLSLGNQYHASTASTAFVSARWILAVERLLHVLDKQAESTFSGRDGSYIANEYRFRRQTYSGTETLNLGGNGNPLNGNSGLIRSAFRPSDDAGTFGFFIPANAMMSVELRRTAKVLREAGGSTSLKLAENMESRSERIEQAIYAHGTVQHRKFGEVFAFEVDGYGSAILMDDANIPSLLALPLLGFVDRNNEIYRNTRKMILSQDGNPYYLKGRAFEGIGGPHVGLENAWPMSVLVQAMTSDDKEEIMRCVDSVKNMSTKGLVHESVNVYKGASDYTRSWFAWANSVFAQTILRLARDMPELIFKEGYGKYLLN
ncbi:MAG: hypothetical protein Q9227_005576 [Pyrenula ochraceoflavens]